MFEKRCVHTKDRDVATNTVSLRIQPSHRVLRLPISNLKFADVFVMSNRKIDDICIIFFKVLKFNAYCHFVFL